MTVEIEQANPYGSLSEERLRTFEQRLRMALPLDYRAFLRRYNGGKPNPNGFWIAKGHDASEVNRFYGLHDGPRWVSLDCYVGEEQHGIPRGLLAIGDDGTGNIICIGIEGERKGAIFFIDHEVHPYDDPDSTAGIYELAKSFSEFLSDLQHMPR